MRSRSTSDLKKATSCACILAKSTNLRRLKISLKRSSRTLCISLDTEKG